MLNIFRKIEERKFEKKQAEMNNKSNAMAKKKMNHFKRLDV